MMDTLAQDIRYAFRQLGRSPGFTAAAVLTLALGIGANAAMFGVMDTLLFRPPSGIVRPDRVVRPYLTRSFAGMGAYTSDVFSYPDFTDLRDHTRSYESVAAYFNTDLSLGRGSSARPIKAGIVTAGFFPLLGVRPYLGRFISPEEDALPHGIPVAVLGYAFWKQQFGGAASALGQQLRIGTHQYSVIGVAPPGFTGPDIESLDLWVPLSTLADAIDTEWATTRNAYFFRRIARLKDGVTREQAAAEATTLYRNLHLAGREPDPHGIVRLGPVQAAHGPDGSREATLSLWLMGVSLIVLLIACANIANLLLARAVHRQREIAIRLTIGASGGRVARQLLVESAMLGLLGGAAALLLVWWGGDAIRALVLPASVPAGTSLDARMIVFTAGIALLTGVLAGLAPVWHARAADLSVALKTGGGVGQARSRLRGALLIGQVMLSVVLLAGAGLLVRSLHNVLDLDLGFDQHQVLVASMDLKEAGYSAAQADAVFQLALNRMQALPGVAHASLAVGTPFSWSFSQRVRLPGRDSLPQVADGGPYINAVTPDFFATMGTTLLRGRTLTTGDNATASRVAIIDQTMARLYWPSADPIGQCMILGSDSTCTQVVGIVKDAHRSSLIESAPLQYYIPLAQERFDLNRRDLFVRASGDPAALIEPVRQALQIVAPDLPYANVRPLAGLLDRQLRPWR
ncbi:MAG: ADOP family duplicated permease, partial [Gemmatimonadota bacterium]